MILPATEDRRLVVFHVWPSLAYPARLAIAYTLVAAGLLVQLAMVTILPGVLLIGAGNLLLVVRGFDNRVDTSAFDPAAEWERVERSRLADLRELHTRMRRWDQSVLDATNARGLLVFLVLAAGGAFLAYRIGGLPRILIIDAMVLLLPHWITGVRSILTLPNLMVRVKLIEALLDGFEERPGGHRVHLLMLLRGGKHKIPDDVKFKVDIKDHPPDFLGLYGQVVINEVQGAAYPYFYVVLVARRDFGLSELEDSYEPPSGRVVELTHQDQVEVLVLRQRTTKTSGYHTSSSSARSILDEGIRLAERATAPTAQGDAA
jgi:hypothetical protein